MSHNEVKEDVVVKDSQLTPTILKSPRSIRLELGGRMERVQIKCSRYEDARTIRGDVG